MPESNLRIVFMGTPDFAVESLKALIDNGCNVVGIITAPDKPAGRGKKIMPSPVKKYAESLSSSPQILQPTNLKDEGFINSLRALKADLQVVVAFRMLPEVVWSMPPRGTINLHASLLPDYRGAAPINWVIINGETETGATTFFIEKEIDTGKIIFTTKVAITDNMNAGELHDKLMIDGADLLVKTVKAIEKKDFPQQSQAELAAGKTLHDAPKIFKEDCRINWQQPGQKIFNLIRGLSPYPASWTEIQARDNQLSMKLFSANFISAVHDFVPGRILSDNKKELKAAVKDGFVEIIELQLAGKKRMSAEEFLRGFPGIETFHFV